MNFETHTFMLCSVNIHQQFWKSETNLQNYEYHKVGKLSKHTGKDEIINI